MSGADRQQAVPPAVAGAGEIVEYDARIRDLVLALQPLAYPNRPRDGITPRWDWMFLQSAARVGEPPRAWFYRDHDGVHAQRAAIMVRLQAGHEVLTAGWLVDTVVLERLRGQAIGAALVERATDALPVSLSLGQSEHMRVLQDRCGWLPVESMRSWLLVLAPRAAFRGRVRRAVHRLPLALAAWGWQSFLRLASPKDTRYQARPVERFGQSHDRLWDAVRSQYRCAVVRDASYLNWKYVDQPDQLFRRLELVDRGGAVHGICIWRVHEASGAHAYRRGWVLDLVVSHHDAGLAHTLLEALVADALDQSVDVIEFDLLAPDLSPHLKRGGWIRTGVTRQLRVSVRDTNAPLKALLLEPGAWYLTRGDSDGDHPWWTPAGPGDHLPGEGTQR